MPKKNVTLRDIAKAAGVTPGTVSFVVTNTYEKRRISEKTVERIRSIAREMGYLPNVAARNLRYADKNKGMLVLCLITSAGAPLNLVSHMFEALQREIAAEPSRRQFMISLATFDPGKLGDLPGLMDGSLFNGAIFTNTLPEDDAFLEKTVLPFPSLVIGREISGYSCFVPSVNAGKTAARMLSEAGCRKPAVLFENQLTQATERRVTQFCDEFQEKSGVSPVRIETEKSSETAARDALDKFLLSGGSLDGLFAVRDNLAAGAYLTLRRYGLSIPEEVKVVGMGDSEWPEYLNPPLSCAGAEESAVYDQAARMILEACSNGDAKPESAYTYARITRRGSA
jgi:LacI family transcriptional regulator